MEHAFRLPREILIKLRNVSQETGCTYSELASRCAVWFLRNPTVVTFYFSKAATLSDVIRVNVEHEITTEQLRNAIIHRIGEYHEANRPQLTLEPCAVFEVVP